MNQTRPNSDQKLRYKPNHDLNKPPTDIKKWLMYKYRFMLPVTKTVTENVCQLPFSHAEK